MEQGRSIVWIGLSTVLAAFAASLCCILPFTVALLGAGSAALGTWAAPWRPVFLIATVVLLGSAFYREYRKDESCVGGEKSCHLAAPRRRFLLWLITVLTLALATFPYYMEWVV